MKKIVLFLLFATTSLILLSPTKGFAQSNDLNLIRGETSILQNASTALQFYDDKDAIVRFREVQLNEDLGALAGVKTNDKINLNLFPDTRYFADVLQTESYFEGNVTIIARLESFDYAFAVISTTDERTLVNIYIPEEGKRFQITSDALTQKHYLIELDPALIPEVEDSPPLIPEDGLAHEDLKIGPRPQVMDDSTMKVSKTFVIVDIMILYTPAARTWGDNNGGGILNCVATTVAIGKIVHYNSGTDATNRLVYTAEVAYTESGDEQTDLDRFTGTTDGYMDGIHTWRNTYGADLVQLFTTMGGGLGWLLDITSGRPQYGFSLVGVSTSSAFSPIHEMGHNMGCGHHKLQNFQPGPGLYSYSAGWRWTGTDGVLYSSTMSYTGGGYFPPNYQSSTRIGYFSNPTINFMGAATGHNTEGDNAWTISNTKAVVAAYRSTATINCLTCPAYDVLISPGNGWSSHSSSIAQYGCKMYAVEVLKGHTYTFQTGCGNGATASFDTYLTLFDNNCAQITYNDDGCESNRSAITWMADYDGYAYLKVSGYSSYYGTYTMAFTREDKLMWTGAVSTNWNTAGNWDSGFVPDGTFDVTIPTGTVRQPYIPTANAACKSLTIESGETLTIGGYSLTVNGNLTISGNLAMNNSAGLLNVSGDVVWQSGSTANFTAASAFRVYGNWTFESGANANIANGTVLFFGGTNKYISNYSTSSSFYSVGSYKTGGAEAGVSVWTSQPFTINGGIYVHPGAKFGIYSLYDVVLKGNINSNGIFVCNLGLLKLDGTAQELRMNAGDYFNNLTFSQTGTVTVNNGLSSILDVNGNVLIESGVFNLADRTMKVGGNWTNNVGSSAFTEGTSRVIFDGATHNYVKTSETFNIIEANMGAALRVDNAGSVVSCNQYDWTSGGIDVVAGTFTALDLSDAGLYGTFWCNPGGAINLTQDASQYPDLHGEIHVFGGTMTVTGGLGACFWPYYSNAVIEMSGGILNFVNNGVYLNTGTYTLTENITGGTIRTNRSFTGDRTDFTPSGGTIELYGSTDAQIGYGLGSNFNHVLINKSATKDDLGNIIEEKMYNRDGEPVDGSRSNIVTASSDLVLLGNMTIQSGQLVAPSSIKLKGNWTNNVGTSGFAEGTGTVTFNSSNHQYCYGETFYGLELNMAAMDLHIPAGTTTTCQIYDWNSGELEVEGGIFIAYDLFDNGIFGKYYINAAGGLLELHQDAVQFVDLNGKIVIANGTMNVYGGNGYSYWPYSANAILTMYGGTLDFKDNGIQIANNSFSLDDNITGGIIRMSKGFYGDRPDFTPTAGTFEFYGSGDYNISQSNGCTLKNVKINKLAADSGGELSGEPEFDERSGIQISDSGKSNTISLGSDFTITGNLEIAAGTFNMNSYTCNVSGTTDIYGTLAMTNAASNLTSGTINWNSGSNDNVTAGTFHADNWRFNEGTNAMLGTGNTAYCAVIYFPTDSDAEFGNLVGGSTSKLLQGGSGKAYYPLRVAGNFTAQSGTWGFEYGLIVMGNAIIQSGCYLSFSYGCDMSCAGSLTLAGGLTLYIGSEATVNGDFIFPNTGSLYAGGGTFTNDFNGGMVSLSGKMTLTTGIIAFPNRSVSISSTFDDQISGGTFRVGKTFAANSAGTFQPSGGTMEFINASSGNYVQVINGNYLYNMVLNKPGSSFMVYDNLTLKGSMTIDAGTLNSNNKTIDVAKDWHNNVGPAAFTEGTGTVIFNGNWGQECSTEEFYRLVLNKPTGDLQLFNGQDVSCQIYQWLDGEIHVSSGIFTAYDLFDNGIFGAYYVDGIDATVDLYQDNSQYVDLNGSIAINNGQMNIYGGNSMSYWPYASNASITMSGGEIDYKDVDIYVYDSPSYTLTENITGGVIRTSGGFLVNVPTFTPTGGTVELYGGLNTAISNVVGSNFHNLAINKSGATDEGFEPLISQDRNGESIMLSRSNEVLLNSDVLINGNLSVNAGKLNMGYAGYDMTCMGSANIENGASLQIGSASQFKLNTALTVKNGGTLNSTGALGFESYITRAATNRYLFDVQSGGNIGSSYTIFEYMGTNGINIASGAVVDPAQAFNNCTFRQGLSANTLLTMNSTQTLECTGAIFPANTWGGTNNIKKTNNAGRITLYDYSGGFAGPGHESDPYNRVDWYTPQLSASPLVINVNPPAGTTSITVSSNLAWTATESSTWFSISPLSGSNNGTITVTYNQNTTAAARSGSIIISAPDVPDVIVTVNQAGATLAVTPASRSVTAPAGTTTFSVASNTTWTVSESISWFTVAPMSGTSNGTLTVNYNQNTATTPRSGQITVSSTGLPNVVVTVNQAGAGATLAVTPANRNVTPAPGITTFAVSSNTSWTVSESVAWFNVSPMSGSGNKTLSVSYGENGTGASRIGSITVTASGGAPSQTATVTQSPYPTQLVALPEGWSGLSSYIMPANDDIEDVFAPVSGDFVIATTMTGIYYPAGPVNTIFDWDSQSTYKIKMDAAATLPIIGDAETNKTLNLAAGWSLIPVIVDLPVDAATTLNPPLDLQIAKEVAGTGVLWPALGINTLGNLMPGKAYFVNLNSAGTFTYPFNSGKTSQVEPSTVDNINHPWNKFYPSPTSHLIAIIADGMEDIHQGDVIGVFAPDGSCYGVTEVGTGGQNTVISVFADDETTEEKSGFKSGEVFSLKLYSHNSGEEYDLEASYDQDMPNGMFFENEGLSVISQLKISGTSINGNMSTGISIYPNPTNDIVWISGVKNCKEFAIINSTGKTLLQGSSNDQDKISIDMSAFNNGIYQLKLTGDKSTTIRKIIKN